MWPDYELTDYFGKELDAAAINALHAAWGDSILQDIPAIYGMHT